MNSYTENGKILESDTKVPQWLEDMSNNVKQKRPGSWRISHMNDSDKDLQISPISANIPRSSGSGIVSLFDDLDGRSSRGSDVSSLRREGSARHGRRAIQFQSAGNSPLEISEISQNCNEYMTFGFTSNHPRARNTPTFKKKTENASPASYTSSEKSEPKRESETISPHKDSLEESWNSLNFFDKRHKGRLCRKQATPNHTGGIVQDGEMSSSSLSRISYPDFIIPELPMGQHLEINIKSTWGDKHYLGLNGIEIFCSTGEPVLVKKIWADPADINVLPEYKKDPRVVSNLLDGVNRTRDDMHLWLAPYTPGANHYIHMVFQNVVQVAMIRIWNYNKSRIHSYRGARDVEISLEDVKIFEGEIARACGGILGGTEAFGDTILFTTDENILESVLHFDHSFSNCWSEIKPEHSTEIVRPITSYCCGERPFTCARSTNISNNFNEDFINGKKVEITIFENWGHPSFVGLTGFEIVDSTGTPIEIEPQWLHSSISSPEVCRLIDGTNLTCEENHMWLCNFSYFHPITLSVVFPATKNIASLRLWNYNSSPETTYCGVKILTLSLDGVPISENTTIRRAPGNCHFNFVQEVKLTKGNTKTIEDDHKCYKHKLTIQLTSNREGTNFHNELKTRSFSMQHLFSGEENSATKGNELIMPLSVSQSAESLHLKELEEEIRNLRSHSVPPHLGVCVDPEYVAPAMPEGFIYQLLLFSTWGDMYYVGLNGLEMYDKDGYKIRLTENNVGAYPESVNILEGVDNDVRTPDKLVDGVNDTYDGRHMWLAPILPNQLNRVYIVFDYPVKVSMIKLWNYSKTPSRGVKEFGILVDDLVVYNGIINKISSQCIEDNKSISVKVPYCTVIFSQDETLIQDTPNDALKSPFNCQERVTSGSESWCSADQSLRPFTSLMPKKSQAMNTS